MKYSNFLKLKEDFSDSPDWGNQLAWEMCCGFTGDARYCEHYIKRNPYWYGTCNLGLDPKDMKDWICPKHNLRNITEEENPKKQEPPDISMWFDIDY